MGIGSAFCWWRKSYSLNFWNVVDHTLRKLAENFSVRFRLFFGIFFGLKKIPFLHPLLALTPYKK